MSSPEYPLPLAVLRHGPTDWSAARRLQGSTDRPLSAEGRARAARWSLPRDLQDRLWLTSPLARARETAALLGHPEARVEPALTEMDWGRWEGETLAALREADPEGMAAAEARGLDLEPPGGESPRRVQARLRPWLASLAKQGRPAVAVCHKGVLRALLALATGWDMTGPPPEKLRDDRWHAFLVAADGGLTVERLNNPLLPP